MSLDSSQPAADRAAAAAAVAAIVVLVLPLVVFFFQLFFFIIFYFIIDKLICSMSAISSHRVTVISATLRLVSDCKLLVLFTHKYSQ